MKAFRFPLDQVLRWRETQVELQKSRVAEASAQLAEISASIEARNAELAAARLSEDSTGAALEACGAFRQRTRTRIRELQGQARTAGRALTLEMEKLAEANRKRKLIGNLKDAEFGDWRREFERELRTFADEAFLGRYNGKSGRARSSGG